MQSQTKSELVSAEDWLRDRDRGRSRLLRILGFILWGVLRVLRVYTVVGIYGYRA